MAQRFGIWAAIAACVASIAYDIPQLLQVVGWLKPPWDLILIFAPSLALAPCFVLTMVALHVRTAPGKAVWSLAGLALAIMYGVLVSIVYITQLGVVIPHTLAGDGDRYAFLACCGPHQFLTEVDLLGYTLMGIATLFAGLALEDEPAAAPARFWLYFNALLTPFIFLQIAYPQLIYVAAAWIVTFPAAMFCLARVFARRRLVAGISVG